MVLAGFDPVKSPDFQHQGQTLRRNKSFNVSLNSTEGNDMKLLKLVK